MTETNQLQQLIIDGIQDRKGKAVTVIDMSELDTAPAQKFIIAQGTSTMQVSAIADRLREYVQEHSGIKPYNYDGYAQSEWIVVDYGEIMAHIFLPPVRERYNLEELWSDAAITDIPDLD